MLDKLKIEFGWPPGLKTEIGQTIQTFSRFIMRSRRHRADNRIDESFLHQMIALDLVFGDRKALNQSVAARTAAATFQAFGKPFSEIKDRVEALYDIRSRYVHEGMPVAEANLDEIEIITREVLACLLRTQAKAEFQVASAFPLWLKNLDYIAAATAAGKAIDPSEFQSNGITIKP